MKTFTAQVLFRTIGDVASGGARARTPLDLGGS